MRSAFIALFCFLSSSASSQVDIKGPWTIQCGASSQNGFNKGTSSINLRYISPRFKWSEEYDTLEEKDPEPFKNMRIMVELMYRPPLKVIALAFNTQYRLIKCKRLTINIIGGVKFLLVAGPDLVSPGARQGRRDAGWYMNMGLQSQLDLGRIAPFVEMGGDYILTIGTEVKFGKIYKKPKSRYKLRKPSDPKK